MVVAYHLLEACQGTGDREQKTGNKKHVHGSCHVACQSLSVYGWLSFGVLCSSTSTLSLYHDSDMTCDESSQQPHTMANGLSGKCQRAANAPCRMSHAVLESNAPVLGLGWSSRQ
jgi:hypothetical protein